MASCSLVVWSLCTIHRRTWSWIHSYALQKIWASCTMWWFWNLCTVLAMCTIYWWISCCDLGRTVCQPCSSSEDPSMLSRSTSSSMISGSQSRRPELHLAKDVGLMHLVIVHTSGYVHLVQQPWPTLAKRSVIPAQHLEIHPACLDHHLSPWSAGSLERLPVP